MAGKNQCSRERFSTTVKKHPAVAVEFVQKGCQPCKNYKQAIKGKKKAVFGDAKVIRIPLGEGLDTCENLADKLGVQATPSICVFKNGVMQGKPITLDDGGKGFKGTFSRVKKQLSTNRKAQMKVKL